MREKGIMGKRFIRVVDVNSNPFMERAELRSFQ